MNTPATHYFIWYRVPGDAARARAAVNALQQDVMRQTGVVGRLLMRPEIPPTWMEVYEAVADAASFEAVLSEATGRLSVASHAPDGRHLEKFVDAL